MTKYLRKISTPSKVSSTKVIDSLNSTSKTDALSADAGRELNEKIKNITSLKNYSTEEVIIGKWINGKPIYRKVVYVNNLANNTTKNVPCNIGANVIDQMIKHELVWYDNIDKGWMYGKRWDSPSIFIEYNYNTANDYMWIRSVGTNWSTRTSKAYAIFEYTKITD